MKLQQRTAERSLYLPLYRGANSEGWGLYRIGDGTWGKKPCDIGGVDPNGRGVCLEVKVVTLVNFDKPINWNQFEAQQKTWLAMFAGRPNSVALVGLFEERTNAFKLIRIISSSMMDAPVKMHNWWTLSLVGPTGNGVYRNWPVFPVHDPHPPVISE